MITTMVIARAVGDQDVQLARHAVGRQHPLHARRCCTRSAFVSMFVIGGLSRHLHGLDAGRHLHPRHLLHRRAHPLRASSAAASSASSPAIYYWFPKMFGRMMNETLGKIHFWLTFIFFNCTFFPMHILGVGGHMRRIYNPTQYEFLKPLQPINVFITDQRALPGRCRRSSSSSTSSAACSPAKARSAIRGTRTRSSGRRRRRRRTATSRDRSRPSTVGRTSTARRWWRRTTCRRRGGSSRRWPPPARTDGCATRSQRSPRPPCTGRATGVRQRAADYVALTKPRVVMMVLVTTLVGFYLGSDRVRRRSCGCCTRSSAPRSRPGGTLALNQYVERDLDARMDRTRHRPLPDGRVHAGRGARARHDAPRRRPRVPRRSPSARLPRCVTAAIAVTYLLLYTPLKPVTSLCSLVGAVPGALPPVAGWAAARGTIGPEAWVLFAIMFLWQIPHSLAIGRMYRDDYARAGIRVLPVVDRDGSSTAIHAVVQLPRPPPGRAPARRCSAWPGPSTSSPRSSLGLGFLWSAIGARPHAVAGRRPAPAGHVARLPPRPPRHDGARQAPDHAMTAGTLTVPRRPVSIPEVREPAVSNTRLAIVDRDHGRERCCSPG